MKVYICSPLRGDIEANIKKAVSYCKEAFEAGYIPIAPHIYFPQFADDNDPMQRGICMVAGLEALEGCSEIWVYGCPSSGMQREIDRANMLGLEVIYKNA